MLLSINVIFSLGISYYKLGTVGLRQDMTSCLTVLTDISFELSVGFIEEKQNKKWEMKLIFNIGIIDEHVLCKIRPKKKTKLYICIS